MIKLIATGVWVCLVTMGASYAAILWKSQTQSEEEVEKFFGGLNSVKTSLISVPVIESGAVQGYVLAQFTFTMQADLLRRMSVKPDVYLLDAAFRTIYGGSASDLRGAKKQDLEALTTAIKSSVNARFGEAFVNDVLIEKYNFLPKGEVRDGANLIKMDPKFAQ
jgi:flagellar basal body-associated protein FliL